MRRISRKSTGIALLAAAAVASCSSLNLKNAGSAVDVISKVGGHVPSVSAHAMKAKDYLAIASKLKKFHDSGALNQDDVLEVLKRGGVIKGPAGSVPRTSGGKAGPKVSQVPPPTETYAGAYRWPLDAGIVSSEFGGRWGKQHKGLDVAADMGVPVKASADGVVLYADSTMRGYGNALIVRHDTRVTTLYAHNKTLLVKNGDHVTQGQTIALLGSTGHSTGPHVHFEIRDGEQAINPRTKLPKSGLAANPFAAPADTLALRSD